MNREALSVHVYLQLLNSNDISRLHKLAIYLSEAKNILLWMCVLSLLNVAAGYPRMTASSGASSGLCA